MAQDTDTPSIPKREPFSVHVDMTFSPSTDREIRERAAAEGVAVRVLIRRYVYRGLAVDRDKDAVKARQQGGTQ